MIKLINANALNIPLADESIHAVVTSPPYYALRDYKTNGQLGLEKRADCLGWATGQPCGECYICKMVAVFREVKRVLRRDGVCFLNIGDSYAGGGENRNGKSSSTLNPGYDGERFNVRKANHGTLKHNDTELKPKDMLLIPSRLALALQADGWWVRSDIIWAKPNPMPESVTDRPTKSHEYVWLLAKSKDYFWDQEAVREENTLGSIARFENGAPRKRQDKREDSPYNWQQDDEGKTPMNGRNLRTVWTIATQPYPGSHYATYPEELVLRCLKAATSERGVCPKCGKQWERVTEVAGQNKANEKWIAQNIAKGIPRQKANLYGNPEFSRDRQSTTLGFRPSCSCGCDTAVPATVFDPFAGSGTTLLVAKRMGLNGIGLDLSYQYLRENAWERVNLAQGMLI